MKKAITILCLLFFATTAFARHGKGGYLVYKYLGAGTNPNTSRYQITVVHYVNCQEVEFELGSVYVGIFNGSDGALYNTIEIKRSNERYIQKQKFDDCINPVPQVCFFLAFYVTTVELPNKNSGYVLAEQECCRANGIANIVNSGTIGTTNSNSIPGVINGVDYHINSSPDVAITDTVVICHNSPFQLPFGTTDPDGDKVTYSFCSADGGGTLGIRQPDPPPSPPYASVEYANPYSGASPLGSNVTIDTKTGLIKGIAPGSTGMYNIAVCITEYRNGVAIAVTKKEILVTVADCTLSAASLQPSYISCNSFSFTFQNESYASNVSSYLWDFGTSVNNDSLLTQPTPSFTYNDTGTYHIKLKVTSGTNCTDSATSVLKIYPGFSAGFAVQGSCFQSPFVFTDRSYARYGTINQYKWNFGDASTEGDTSNQKNASYQYPKAGNVTATLIVASDKGCVDTATKTVVVNNKPQIIPPFTDTLICKNDTLALPVQGSGNVFSWTPVYNISNASISNPLVSPFDTTVYTLVVHDKQCVDSIRLIVNVIDSVTLNLSSSIKLCATDSVQLSPVSNALYYRWHESNNTVTLNNPTIQSPVVAPLQNTVYRVTASVGHCKATAQTVVLVSPYPTAAVNGAASICFGNTVQLHASTKAAHYMWSSASSLTGANTLNPLAGPQQSTAYVLTISDTFYCTKSVTDTVLVQVIPLPEISLRNDTSAVIGQPLQLIANTNEEASFRWFPATNISSNSVSNPVITVTNFSTLPLTYFVTATTSGGCAATDSIHIKVYKTKPDIFVPSAFTPNGDGRNDVFKPVAVGIAKLYFFRVMDRWGRLLFQTKIIGTGWDGLYDGELQPAGTYVFEIKGSDYEGNIIEKRGTVVLIR